MKKAPARKPAAATTAVYDWSRIDSPEDALALVRQRDPQQFSHGMLVQDPPSMFSWGWYWFASPEGRLQFVTFIEPRLEDMSAGEFAEFQAEAAATLLSAGAGPAGPAVLADLGFNGGTVDWVGTLRELTHGDDAGAKKCRRDFWESRDDDGEAPIPDDLVEEFIDSLHPE